MAAVVGAVAALIAFVYNKLPIGVSATYPPPATPPAGDLPEQYPGEFA